MIVFLKKQKTQVLKQRKVAFGKKENTSALIIISQEDDSTIFELL